MLKSMWWSHIPNIDFLPVLVGAEPGDNENVGDQPGAGGAGTGAQGDQPTEELDPQKKIAALEDEKNRHWTLKEQAEAKLNEVTPELEELRKFKEEADNAKLSADEKVQKEIEGYKTTIAEKDQIIEQLQNGQKQLAVHNAFLQNKEVQWHKPERALALADLSEVEIESKNGVATIKNPDAITKAIKALAESDPYLVNSTEGPSNGWNGSTGDKPKNQKPKAAAAREQELKEKYPGLKR